MQRDGAGHRIGPGVMQPGQQHIAHKNLRALGDVEDYIHLAGIGAFGLLGDVDADLIEATAQVVGKQRVAVSGQVLRRKQLARRGVQQGRELGRIHVVVAFHRTVPRGAVRLLQSGR